LLNGCRIQPPIPRKKGKPLIGGVLAVGTKRSTRSRTTLKRQK
jgi:hypothetical protein